MAAVDTQHLTSTLGSCTSPRPRSVCSVTGSPRSTLTCAACAASLLTGRAWIDYLPGWLEGHEAIFESLRVTTAVAAPAPTHVRADRRRPAGWSRRCPRMRPGTPCSTRRPPPCRVVMGSSSTGSPSPTTAMATTASPGTATGWAASSTTRWSPSCPSARRGASSSGRPQGGPSRAFDLGWGDLLVMGGNCQRTWQHAVAQDGPRGPPDQRPVPPGHRATRRPDISLDAYEHRRRRSSGLQPSRGC